MEEKEFESYLNKRYYPEIEWYDKKSALNQRVYTILQWNLIILSAITPVLVTIGGTWERWSAVITSCLVAIGTASLKTFKYQEKWMHYRTTCETLRKEIHFYKAGIGDYEKCIDPIKRFIQRVETLISQENTIWITFQKKKEDKTVPSKSI